MRVIGGRVRRRDDEAPTGGRGVMDGVTGGAERAFGVTGGRRQVREASAASGRREARQSSRRASPDRQRAGGPGAVRTVGADPREERND